MSRKEVSAWWLNALKALKKKDQIYGQRIAEMAEKHSGEAFYAPDDPLDALWFFADTVILRTPERTINV